MGLFNKQAKDAHTPAPSRDVRVADTARTYWLENKVAANLTGRQEHLLERLSVLDDAIAHVTDPDTHAKVLADAQELAHDCARLVSATVSLDRLERSVTELVEKVKSLEIAVPVLTDIRLDPPAPLVAAVAARYEADKAQSLEPDRVTPCTYETLGRLPDGLVIDSWTGVISGQAQRKWDGHVIVVARPSLGVSRVTRDGLLFHEFLVTSRTGNVLLLRKFRAKDDGGLWETYYPIDSPDAGFEKATERELLSHVLATHLVVDPAAADVKLLRAEAQAAHDAFQEARRAAADDFSAADAAVSWVDSRAQDVLDLVASDGHAHRNDLGHQRADMTVPAEQVAYEARRSMLETAARVRSAAQKAAAQRTGRRYVDGE